MTTSATGLRPGPRRWAGAGLPGLALPGRPAGPLPRDLLAPGALLLAGAELGRAVRWADHVRRWGPTPRVAIGELVDLVATQAILGAGGAGFPADRKLASLAGSRVSMVVVNGAEGEAASGKDAVLLAHNPHLVLDGAVVAARALGAPRVVVRIAADRPHLASALPAALADRRDGIPIELSTGPAAFAAGEASAVIRSLGGGPCLPADLGRPPAPPRRLGRRPTRVLLSNVETFARVGVAARGEASASCLASVSGAVRQAGVVELAEGATLGDLVDAAGGLEGTPEVLITGGWHGRWVPWGDQAAGTQLSRAGLTELGGRWGAGAFVWVPGDLPVWEVVAAVARELAAGSARQCGPCWRGLPDVAQHIGLLAAAAGPERVQRHRAVEDLLAEIDGRGICAHPSASVAALRSALGLLGARG